MRLLLTAAIFFTASLASAQIVNIPDPGFKQYLLEYDNPVIDTNGDGEIQESEAQAITTLYLADGFSTFTDITGMKSFTNLDTLGSSYLETNNIDLSGMESLHVVYLEGGHIHNVNISNCSNLEVFSVENGYGSYYGDSIINLALVGNHRLKTIYCGQLNLPELDLRQCDSLVDFKMGIGDIQGMLDVSGLQKLENLHMLGHVGAINANGDIKLKNIIGATFAVEGVTTENIFLNNCSSIEMIQPIYFNGTSMDVSNCPNLWALNMVCSHLQYLNLKNNNAMPVALLQQNLGIYIDNPNPQPLYICTDDNETADVLNSLSVLNPSVPLVANSFCSASPGGMFNTIKGKVHLDGNNNGCDNTDEEVFNFPVRIFNGTYSAMQYSNINGDYRHYDFAGNFTVTPYFPYPYFSVSPGSANIIFDTANNIIDTLDFCITPNGMHNQLEITMVPAFDARPGFNASYMLTYRNRGTSTASGTIQLNYDNSRVGYQDTGSGTVAPGQITWNYDNLLPLQTRSFYVTFNVFAPPTNNIGDTLIYLATINPVAGDETPSNNSFILPQGIRNSHDPNEKICIEGGQLDIAKIGDKLHYVIRFQNLGTDTAFNVVVTDTLSDNFDWESFDFTASSHPCIVKRIDNKLEFYFQNIKLPYQSVDDAGSSGFIAFEIKPKNNAVIGDSLNNKASIYFDFNAAVVTNTTSTIVSPASAMAVKLEYFSLAAKNEGNQLVWKASAATGLVDFAIERSNDGIHFTNIGNITASVERCQSPFSFTDAKPFDGKTFYRLNIKDANGISFYSKILSAERTRSGLSIVTAIVSNQNNTNVYLNSFKEQNIRVKVIAADGRLLYNQTKTIAAGSSTLSLPLKNLSTGIYTLVVHTSDGEMITKRFIK